MADPSAGDLPPDLPEYAENPFIARLPGLMSQRGLLQALASRPRFDEKERGYEAHIRKHCIVRLARYFEPMARQVQLAERFGMLLRQGYVGRNPLTHAYIAHLHAGAARIETGALHVAVDPPAENTATSFALVGCSGSGKTLSMEKILRLYPQTIAHQEPFSLMQIVWLRLESPSQGSPKQLCINFFSAVDRLIGTDYARRFAGRGVSAEQMLVYMAQVAQLHALGVLVVDEIQHLKQTKLGPQALLNFLVTLVNTIGVPVILIGTLGAVPILQGNFSQARRASGLGSLVWERLQPGASWDRFVERLWKYQWVREPAPLTPGLRAALYEESQGIVDIVVKLFMLAQLRVVGISGAGRRQPETLTEKLFRQVARDEFSMVRPMLEALRANDAEKIARYDDLRPLQDHVHRVLASAVGETSTADAPPAPALPATAPEAASSPIEEKILASLASLGVADDVARALIEEAGAEGGIDDPLLLMSRIAAKLSATPVKRKKPRPEQEAPSEMPREDLRRLVAEGKSAGKTGYEALRDAGAVRPPLQDFGG